jgi:hypothetical protein
MFDNCLILMGREFMLKLKLVFSDELIDVYFRPGFGSDLVVFFAPMEWNRSSSPVWGDALAVSLGLNAIFLVPRGETWYPFRQMSRALDVVADYCRQYSDVILYGYSMGGYGALKFSRYLGASRVIAFSPQSSIEPVICVSNDRRYFQHYVGGVHDGMSIGPEDVVDSDVFVFFDENYGPDRFQVDLMRHSGVGARYISLRGMSHSTVLCLSSSSVFSRILQLISMRKSEDSDIAHFLVHNGRNSWVYYYNLVVRAFESGHYRFVLRLCDLGRSRVALAGTIKVDELDMYRAKSAYMRRSFDFSFSICSGIQSDTVLNSMALFYLRWRRFSWALSLMLRIGSLRQSGYYCRNIAVIYERLGALDEALEFASLAVAIEPENFHFHGSLARILMARSEFGRAYDEAVIAERMSGGHEYFVQMRESLEEQLEEEPDSV